MAILNQQDLVPALHGWLSLDERNHGDIMKAGSREVKKIERSQKTLEVPLLLIKT